MNASAQTGSVAARGVKASRHASGSFDPAAELTADGRPQLQVRLALWGKIHTLVALVYWPLWALDNGTAAFLDLLPMMLGGTAWLPALWLVGRGKPRSVAFLKGCDVGVHLVLGCFIGFTLCKHPVPRENAIESLAGVMFVVFLRSLVLPSGYQRSLLAGGALIIAPIAGAATCLATIAPGGVEPSHFLRVFAVWCLVSVVVGAFASHVLYGLGRQVRDARRLGQYTLLDELGRGGMGVVYRARHGMLRRPTAIKLLSEQGGERTERFEREVQLMAELNHPNVVTVHDYGRTSDGVFYYAMELLDGIDLQALVDTHGPQPASRVIHILRQACRGLARAHHVSLVHRDIKPANIFLCRDWGAPDAAKLLDFGLVKRQDQTEAPGLTSEGRLLGTPLYMAPEALTDPDVLDARADLYALGAVAYFLLVGEPVFSGRTIVEVAVHHVNTTPVPLHVRSATPVSEQLDRIILRCLDKDPEARFPDANALGAALSSCPEADQWTDAQAAAWWNGHHDAAHKPSTAPIGYVDTIDTRRA